MNYKRRRLLFRGKCIRYVVGKKKHGCEWNQRKEHLIQHKQINKQKNKYFIVNQSLNTV